MNAINWMIEKAQETITLEDGTVTKVFVGKLPGRMAHEVRKAATRTNDTRTVIVYSDSGDVYDWSASFGGKISTNNTVRFTYNDYTVPASK